MFFVSLLPFVFLWLILINQLRVEWTVNPQYNYGWAVPFLCVFLAYRRWKMGDGRGGMGEGAEGQSLGATRHLTPALSPFEAERETRKVLQRLPPISYLPSSIFCLLFALLALLYAPTRLIQEANPEWRLVSWALALEVVGLTLLFLSMGDGRWKIGDRSGGVVDRASLFPLPSSLFRALAFPLLFFLVAVPWPTFVEQPAVELLTRANVGVVIELLNGLGIPALQQGNVIEISNGLVGIDEACSGIRSVQATLMISLFLGEFYGLRILRRVGLCFCGLAAAFVFNVVRTFLLTWVASKQGLAVMAQWHDPAGVGVLFACFLSVWGLATAIGKAESRKQKAEREGVGGGGEDAETRRRGDYIEEDGRWETEGGRREKEGSPASNRSADFSPQDPVGSEPEPTKVGVPFAGQTPAPVSNLLSSIYLPSALLLWLLVVEGSVEVWYRIHEAKLPRSVQWNAHAPTASAGSKELPLAETARQLLRYDEAQNTTWRDPDGTRWQMIYLRWRPGRVAVHLAKSHTPEVCLTAAGRKLEAMADLKLFTVQGLRLPFRSYMYREGDRPVYVFYCLWEDRSDEQVFNTTMLTYDNRFSPVWAGRRNLGQRVLEMAVWGMDDLAQAEAGLKKQLDGVIQKQSRN